MVEVDIFIDTPTEPQVLVPKVSLIERNRRSFSIPEPVPPLPKTPREFDIAIEIIKPLNKAKFPVFLTKCHATHKNFAMKIFPLEEGKPHEFFNNEIRFAKFDHPNIVKIVHSEEKKKIYHHDKLEEFSYVLMEYAPYGDFFDLLENYTALFNEKMIRTYFRQFIDGLEYIHKKKAAHLDLKLENLLLGKDYKLKIADFDLSYFKGDIEIFTKGTKYYRAPEMIEAQCSNFQASDIYSAGVILFVFKSGGLVPHSENLPFDGVNLLELFNNNNENFWKKHCDIQNQGPSYFSQDFKDLVNGMMRSNPKERFTMKDIRNSKWFNGPIYSDQELKARLDTIKWQ